VKRFTVTVQPREIHFREVGRSNPAGCDKSRKRRNRLECDALGRLADVHDLRSRGVIEPHPRSRASLRLFAGQERSELNCRLRVERDVDLPQRFVILEVAVDVPQHHLFFGIGELKAIHLFSALDRFFSESQRRVLLLLCGQLWKRDTCRDSRRQGFDEPTAPDWLGRALHEISS
jgi:hypothetical protein